MPEVGHVEGKIEPICLKGFTNQNACLMPSRPTLLPKSSDFALVSPDFALVKGNSGQQCAFGAHRVLDSQGEGWTALSTVLI